MKSKIHKPFSVSPWLSRIKSGPPIHSKLIKKSLPVFFFFVFGVMSCVGQNQGISNYWIMGYSSYGGLPFGNTIMNFFNGNPIIFYDSLEMEFNHTHSNISDTAGNLLFYTNGFYIADASNDTMQNGQGINPSSYTSYFADGLGIPQANLILPLPNSNNLFYFIHSTLDKYPGYTCSRNLYLSIIDMNLNGGLGAVTTKNQIVLTDSMIPGKISACKHGNGRDWWIFLHQLNSNLFYKFLLTPNGLSGPFTQNIGNVKPFEAGQSWFSADGTRYAYYYIYAGLDIYDFDRCTGDLSNPTHISIPYAGGLNVGMAISPNSNVLYVSNSDSLIQFDLSNTNIAATQQTVAVYDSFQSWWPPYPPIGTFFGLGALAPDGKIYFTTGSSTFHMHVINNPDSLGLACNVIQHGVQLPAIAFNTLPNHPNYFLGRDTGSVCDTITSWLGLNEEPPDKITPIKVLPNPNNGNFTLWFSVHDKPGWLDVYDVNGNLILHEGVAPWSQYKQVNISPHPDGIYFCKMLWGDWVQGVKVIKN